MSTSDHPETGGQTERVNRVLEEILRGYVQSYPNWSEFLPMVPMVEGSSSLRGGVDSQEQIQFWLMLITRRK